MNLFIQFFTKGAKFPQSEKDFMIAFLILSCLSIMH